jgi:hypothetical protein
MWGEHHPKPGDLAPNSNAIDFTPHVQREQRRAWEASQAAWLNANGLTWTPDELRAWWDSPDRDRLPMPGVLQWQQRISQQHSLRAEVIGVQPAYPSTGPVLDAAAARETHELRQARDADAERITWLEDRLTQAASDLSDSAAKRAALADYVSRQEDIIREQAALNQQQAAAIEQDKASIAQLNRTIGQHKAEAQRHDADADAARLNTAITDKDAEIRELKATVTAARKQALAPDAESSPELRHHEQTAAQQADMIRDLKSDNQRLRERADHAEERVDRLENENERLRERLTTSGRD